MKQGIVKLRAGTRMGVLDDFAAQIQRDQKQHRCEKHSKMKRALKRLAPFG